MYRHKARSIFSYLERTKHASNMLVGSTGRLLKNGPPKKGMVHKIWALVPNQLGTLIVPYIYTDIIISSSSSRQCGQLFYEELSIHYVLKQRFYKSNQLSFSSCIFQATRFYLKPKLIEKHALSSQTIQEKVVKF